MRTLGALLATTVVVLLQGMNPTLIVLLISLVVMLQRTHPGWWRRGSTGPRLTVGAKTNTPSSLEDFHIDVSQFEGSVRRLR